MTWPTQIIVSPDLAPQPHLACLRGSTHHLCCSTQPWGLGSTLTLQPCFVWLLLLFTCFSLHLCLQEGLWELPELPAPPLPRSVMMCVWVWVPVCGHHCTVHSVIGVIKIGIKEPGFATAASRQIRLYKLEATKTCESFFLSFWFSVCLFLREGSNAPPAGLEELSTMALNFGHSWHYLQNSEITTPNYAVLEV